LFSLELTKHPAGIITLILVCLIALVSIFFSIDSIVVLSDAKLDYGALDFYSLDRYINRGTITYETSTVTFNFGFAGYALFLLSSLFMLITVARNAFTVKKCAKEVITNEKK